MRHPLSLLKWASYATSLAAVLTAIGWIAWAGRPSAPAQETPAANEAATRIDRPQIVERRNEKVIWRLQAERAEQEGMHLALQKPRLALRAPSGGWIPIAAQRGWFDPATRALSFAGDVRARWRQWTLVAKELRYDPANDALVAPQGAVAERNGARIEAGRIVLWRKQQRLQASRGVHLVVAAELLR